MKHLPSFFLGAALALTTTWLLSAGAPDPLQDMPSQLKTGGTVFGFSMLSGGEKALGGLTPNTPVTIREMRGRWLLIDFPTQTTGPVWVNSNALVSFRINR